MIKIKLILFIFLILLLFACEKQQFTNPVDTEVELIPPTNLEITQASISSTILTWQDNSEREDSFMIDRRKNSEEWNVGYQSVFEDETTFVDSFLEVGQTYCYRVYSFESENVSSALLDTVNLVFSAPANLHVSKSTITSCLLEWDDNCIGEDGFKIDRKKDEEEWICEYKVLEENIEEFVDTDLLPESIYLYRLSAYYGDVETESVENEIHMVYPVPYAFNITAVSFASCSLDWDYESIGDEDGFKLERQSEDNCWSVIADLPLSERVYVDSDVVAGEYYEYKIYPYNSLVTQSVPRYSDIVMPPLEFTDIDGNLYNVVQIGDQFWMKGNLMVTHYRNGDDVGNVTGSSEWSEATDGAYCCYYNDEESQVIYGNLYNWYATVDERNLAPEGWHIPSDNEIKELESNLGMSDIELHETGWRGTVEGSIMASNATLWNNGYLTLSSQFGSSGFDLIPGGYRKDNGIFSGRASSARIWSTTTYSSSVQSNVWNRTVGKDRQSVFRSNINKHCGLSIRCLWGE